MKRGSALLMVLGMMAFLVISAVAFSAYMRSSRLPSSFLLRTSSSRNLVKAAMAEAIEAVDDAVADNPHPGVGGAVKSNLDDDAQQTNANRWFGGRVLRGTGDLVDPEETVPTLTLEGLAYLPPPLINVVRYYSRRVTSAKWHDFDFDAGRYAYVAVDVSDYFDVNRTQAAPKNAVGSGGRSSADNGRVTLAYLFENSAHTDWKVDPEDWDTFMKKFGLGAKDSTKVPFVSWADLNLAIWADGSTGLISPWCRVVAPNGGELDYVKEDNEDRFAISNMVFVTDSWYPPAAKTTTGKNAVSLASTANQPFGPALKLDDEASYAKRSLETILQNVNQPANLKWADWLAPPEMVQLADYLDADSVPSTLALPSVERTPMVTGVSIGFEEMRPIVTPAEVYSTPEFSAGNDLFRYEVRPYELKLSAGECIGQVGLVFPFKHRRDKKGSWNVQAYATVTFAKDGFENLRLPSSSEWALKPDWQASEKSVGVAKFSSGNQDSLPSGFVICSKKQSVSEPDVTGVDSAVMNDVHLEFGTFKQQSLVSELSESYNGINGLKKDKCTLRVMQKKRKVVDPNNPQNVSWEDDGDPITQFGALPANDNLTGAVTPAANDAFRPTVQVWVRVTDASTSAPVDLVPASWSDDLKPCDLLEEATGSSGRPALRFTDGSGSVKVVYDGKQLVAEGVVQVAPFGYMTDDPRFNYAPENFWKQTSGQIDFETTWKEKAKTTAGARDGDIFMATSDAGYLQSWYELAFLTKIVTGATDDWGCLTGGAYNGRARNGGEALAADSVMWRTFRPFKNTDGARDAIFDEGDRVTCGTSGTRVCPYTSDTAVMMGALANTPVDWWAAGTNATTAKTAMLKDIDEALKYTFSTRNSETQNLKWEYLEDLARDFINGFRGATAGNWKTVYDNFPWSGSGTAAGGNAGNQTFLDALQSDAGVALDSVDRKYLYGFWRECFAARQQLFLVFVRAEPTMMGSGTVGKAPPTLGGRAVALVWRDPAATTGGAPHRSRLLFYRQFE